MKEITKSFPNTIKYDLNKIGNPEKILFFDIETTGLSPKNSSLYLIGCISIGDTITFKQWFAQSLSDEAALLQSFYSYAKDFDTLIHFNGDSFDLPYIRECSKQYYLFNPLDNYRSIDIYKIVRYLKKPLNLGHINQKSIEEYLGLNRTDLYNGKVLIDFYYRYLKSHEKHLLDALLLHNEEDLLGMLKVMDMLAFVDFLNSDFKLNSYKVEDDALTLNFYSNEFSNLNLKLEDDLMLYISGNKMKAVIPILNTELKYFFSNYKDYYYLTIEDYAIHKSVGEFVNKSVKKRATKQNAYVKKHSLYIPCFELTPSAGSFRYEYKSKEKYMDLNTFNYKDADFIRNYAKEILNYFKLLKY